MACETTVSFLFIGQPQAKPCCGKRQKHANSAIIPVQFWTFSRQVFKQLDELDNINEKAIQIRFITHHHLSNHVDQYVVGQLELLSRAVTIQLSEYMCALLQVLVRPVEAEAASVNG